MPAVEAALTWLLGTLSRNDARHGSMKSGNGADFARGRARARKREDERGRADATRDMRWILSV